MSINGITMDSAVSNSGLIFKAAKKTNSLNSLPVQSYTEQVAKFDVNNLKANYLKHNSPSFCGTKSNYITQDSEKGGRIPIIIEPGVDLRHYGDGGAAYPGFKIKNADFSNGKLDRCYMKNSEILNSNLTDVNMYKIHLHNSNLTGSNFTRAYLPDSILKGSDFTDVNLTDIRGVRSNFQDCKFKNTNFNRAELTNANFMGADMSGAKNLDKASLGFAIYDDKTKFPSGFNPEQNSMLKFEKGADLRGIILKEAVIKSKDPYNPDDYSQIDFGVDEYLPTDLRRTRMANVILDYCKFKEVDARGMSLAGSSLYGATFEDVNLDGADLHGMMTGYGTTFIDSGNGGTTRMTLRKANVMGAELAELGIENLPDGALSGAIYSNTTTFPAGFDPKQAGMKRMGPGENFSNYDFTGMSFRDSAPSKAHLMSIANAKFKRADFTDCDLCDLDMRNADFTEAYFRGAEMHKTNCEGASFLNAKLPGADLTGANMKNTDLRWAKMQGVIVDEKTDFAGAKYNDDTLFPEKFSNSIKNTMVFIPRNMAPGY